MYFTKKHFFGLLKIWKPGENFKNFCCNIFYQLIEMSNNEEQRETSVDL